MLGTNCSKTPRAVVHLVKGLNLSSAGPAGLAVLPLGFHFLNVGAVFQHDITQITGGGGSHHMAGKALCVNVWEQSGMINSLLNDIITMTAMQSSKHQLEMVFDLDPKIPSVLIGDMEKISHVLKILLENSIKFTEEGGVNIRIKHRQENSAPIWSLISVTPASA